MNKATLVCFLAVLVILVACGGTVLPPTPVATLVPAPTPTPTETPHPTPTLTPVAVPSYMAEIGVWDAASGKFYGRGSTFLVDREKRLFATNAHITQGDLKGKFFRIRVNGVWYSAHTKEDWINWHADAAVFRLEAPEDLVLPESARLGNTPAEDSDVRVMGYLADPALSHLPDASLVPYFAEALILSKDVGWDVNIATRAERAILMDEYLASLPEGTVTLEIPREMRAYYYRHFVMIMLKELVYDQRFRPGTSGMPLARQGGEVVGMVAGAIDFLGIFFGDGGDVALAVPVEEIKKLRDKVINGMLD